MPGRWLGGNDRQLRAMLVSLFVRQRLGTFVARQPAADLELLASLIEDGKVTPVVDTVFPLGDAAEAIRRMRAGQAKGKLVLRV